MRVLVADDGSDSSDQAVDLVASVSGPAASEVRIVTAHPLIFSTSAPAEIVDGEFVEQIFEDEQPEAERLATSARRRVERPGVVAFSEVTAGRPASVILEAVEIRVADLLVVESWPWPVHVCPPRFGLRGARRPRSLSGPCHPRLDPPTDPARR